MEGLAGTIRCARRPARWVALLACGLSAPSPASSADTTWATEQIGFSRAVDLLRTGGDHAYAIEMLQRIARQGDARAQVLLAGLYFEGREIPPDPVLGHAWLMVATSGESYFVEDTSHWAQDMLISNGAHMTGAQLIAAETLAARMLQERSQARDAGIRAALHARYTAAEPADLKDSIRFAEPIVVSVPDRAGDSPTFRPGCAVAGADDCPAQAANAGAVGRCAGNIEPASRPAAISRSKDSQPLLSYPTAARRWGLEGRAIVLVHIDRSGWACGVSIALSSGSPLLDHAAIDSVRRWHFEPALSDGQSVESFAAVATTFRISGYKFRQ